MTYSGRAILRQKPEFLKSHYRGAMAKSALKKREKPAPFQAYGCFTSSVRVCSSLEFGQCRVSVCIHAGEFSTLIRICGVCGASDSCMAWKSAEITDKSQKWWKSMANLNRSRAIRKMTTTPKVPRPAKLWTVARLHCIRTRICDCGAAHFGKRSQRVYLASGPANDFLGAKAVHDQSVGN